MMVASEVLSSDITSASILFLPPPLVLMTGLLYCSDVDVDVDVDVISVLIA